MLITGFRKRLMKNMKAAPCRGATSRIARTAALIGVVSAALAGGSPYASAQGQGVFLPSETAADESTASGVTVLRSRLTEIDLEALAAAQTAAESATNPPLVLNLFDDVVFFGIVERTAPTYSGGYVLSGSLDGVALGSMTLVVNGSVVAGTVLTPGATYRIRPAGNGLHVIRQIAPSTLPPGGEPLRAAPPETRGPDEDPSTAADDDGSVIDVAVFHTPAAQRSAGGSTGIEAVIDLMVAETNQAYADSAVIQRVRLVARELVGYSEASSGGDDLNRLRDRTDGHMDGVHGIRDRTGADLVHLIVDRDHGGNFDVCGKAYIPTVRLTGDFKSFGFALTDYRCGGYTFAHELGHNMSLTHDRYTTVDKSVVVHPYGFGYVNQQAFASGAPESTRWHTIMARGSQCVDAGFSCSRILRFSNPNQTYAGDRLGVPGDHRDDSVTGPSDARRALNNTRRTVANFRPTRFRCSFTLRPAYHYVLEYGGGPFEFEVVANSSLCSWNASTNDGFLRATQASGTGNGVVRYHVEEHTGAATRVGTITVGNATFTVTQFVGLTQPSTLTSSSAQPGHAGSPAANGMALPPVVRGSVASIAASETADIAGLRRWDTWVDAMARTDALVLRGHRADRQVPGRTHESFTQYHLGVPVHGGGVSRQLDRGVTVSIFGTVHRSIDVETIPSISAEETAARLEAETGTSLVLGQLPVLVVFPLPDGLYALTWQATLNNARTYFVNAHTGRIVFDVAEAQAQSAVGSGVGIRGHRKKVSATRADGTFQALDRLRPGETLTLDVRHDGQRLEHLLGPARGGVRWVSGDVASDADNAWDDPAVVDAHVHAGWTYDYFALAHGYAGIDGKNGRVVGLVNNGVPDSFFLRPPFGPEGAGAYVFGEAPDGTPLVAEDLVAHELMHGVTFFAVNGRTGSTRGLVDTLNARRPNLRSFRHGGRMFTCDTFRFRYTDGLQLPAVCEDGRFVLFSNQARAVNEAFSDIFATAVEFFHHDAGSVPLPADYLIGEDIPDGPTRSLANPRSRTIGGATVRYPDAAQGALEFLVGFDGRVARWIPLAFVNNRFAGELPSTDAGGAHWNSTILSHAFYLAIEGGRNATTGRSVTGVGRPAARDVEQVYFRAITELMPAHPDFSITGAVIRQAAVDLFGTGSTTHRTIDQALRAVGL